MGTTNNSMEDSTCNYLCHDRTHHLRFSRDPDMTKGIGCREEEDREEVERVKEFAVG